MPATAIRKYFSAFSVTIALIMGTAACTSIPITSMYRLSQMSPLDTDPTQIRVAIRVDEMVNVADGAATITMAFKADDNSVDAHHEFAVQIDPMSNLSAELQEDMLPGEQVIVLSLSAEDASTMANLQQLVREAKSRDVKGQGTFGLAIGDMCLREPLPERDVPLTLFLQTDVAEGYFVFLETDMQSLMEQAEQSDTDMLSLCGRSAQVTD